MSIGSQIATKRRELKMSQEKLAERVNVSFQAVSAWEREIYFPETDKLQDIASALGTSIGWLLEEDSTNKNWVLNDEMFSAERMYKHVLSSVNALKYSQSPKALVLMKTYHEGQTRKGVDKLPYIVHPLTVACHGLALGIGSDELIAAALLHDVVEDCGVKLQDLDVNDEVKEAVRLLTYVQKPEESRHEAKLRYYEEMKQNKTAAMVKLLDRCNNVSVMATGFTKEKMIQFIEETEEFVFPLLDYVKHNYLEYYDAVFLIRYQLLSVMESLKRTL